MTSFYLNPLVASVMLAGSLYAMTVRAADPEVGATVPAQTDEVDTLAYADVHLSGSLIATDPPKEGAASVEGVAGPGRNGQKPDAFGDHGEETDAVSTAPVDDASTPLAPFALTHANIAVTGPDSNETVPNIAVGPQYSLSSSVKVGGIWEGHDALGLHADNSRYTFGLRLTF